MFRHSGRGTGRTLYVWTSACAGIDKYVAQHYNGNSVEYYNLNFFYWRYPMNRTLWGRIVCLGVALLFFAIPSLLHGADQTWSIGYAERNLVPKDIGTKTYYMAGYSNNKPIKGVHDPIWVRCISLDAGAGQKIVLASLDVVGFPYSRVLSVRQRLEDWSKENNVTVQVFSTHSHASIDTMGMWGPLGKSGCDKTWMESLENSIIEAAMEALAHAVPGQLSFGQIMAPGMVVDKSPPQVPNEQISVFRFQPENENIKPVWLMHFSCHPEALEDVNTFLSSDFVHAARETIEKTENCHALYINGAVGSMQTVPELRDENGVKTVAYEAIYKFGRELGEIALKINNWQNVAPFLSLRTEAVTVPIYNPLFILFQTMKVIDARPVGGEYSCDPKLLEIAQKSPDNPHLPTTSVEVAYMKIGKDIGIVYVPGELAPELANGAYLPPERCNNPGLTPEKPLFEIMPDKIKLVFGLANDEIGYILPRNDYFISPTQPWIDRGVDRFGYRHYPETNSTGPDIANIVSEALERLVK